MMRAFLGLLLLLTGSAAAQNAVGLNTHLPSADELDAAAASGVTWIRIDNNWINVERAEGRPDWAALDRVVDGAVERGLSVYMTVAYAPPWAHEPDGDDVPTNNVPRPGLYERYLRATVERYRDRVQHYGLWNEANLSQFWSGDAEQYVERIVHPGAAAIRAACPHCTVLGPDLAGIGRWQDYLEVVMRGAGDAFDVVTHHSYASPQSVRAVWACDDFAHSIDIGEDAICFYKPGLRQVLDGAGWHGLVWMTEVGYRTDPWDRDSEQRKQRDTLAAILALQQATPWWTHTFIYELSDCGVEQPDCTIDGYGLLRRAADRDATWADNFVLKPAFTWLQGELLGNAAWGAEPDPVDPPDPDPPAAIIHAPHRPAGQPDGMLDDWDDRGCAVLTRWEGLAGDRPSANDLSARACAAWSDAALWLSVEVRDQIHHNPFPEDQLWRGDSVQLAVDFDGDGGDDGYDDDDAEWTLAATPGGSVLRTEHGAQAATGIVVAAAPFARYELRIPVPALADGRTLRASFLINENDGAERLGWLEWTPGIGQGKRPSAFGQIVLEAREAQPPDAGPAPVEDAGPPPNPVPLVDAGAPRDSGSLGGDARPTATDAASMPSDGPPGLGADLGATGQPAGPVSEDTGCQSAPAPVTWFGLLGALGLLGRRRRRAA